MEALPVLEDMVGAPNKPQIHSGQHQQGRISTALEVATNNKLKLRVHNVFEST
jgi:hypothetical protein